MPSKRDTETDKPKRQITLKVVFISISLIGIGLGMIRIDGLNSAPGIVGFALVGAGICIPVGWLKKGNIEGAMRWAVYGVGAAMLIAWFRAALWIQAR